MSSQYQLQVEVRPETEKHWLILIQVAINGEVKQLTSCVSESGISVTSDRAEADIVFHGRCDAFTAVFSVTTPEERLSVPLSVTVTPRYNINSPVIHKLDRSLADLVGIVHNTGFYLGIGGVDVIDHYYKRTQLELGAYRGPWGSSAADQKIQNKYTSKIQQHYPSPIQNYDQVKGV